MENMLIIVSGHPGAGKTTTSKIISKELNLPLISVDAIKEMIWDNSTWETDRQETDKIGRMSFELLYYFIHASLSKGKSLIVDANFAPGRSNERLNEVKEKYNAKLVQVYCHCDLETMGQRRKARMTSDSYHAGHKYGITNFYGGENYFSYIGESGKKLDIEETIEIDTTNPENIDYAKIFEFIKKNNKL